MEHFVSDLLGRTFRSSADVPVALHVGDVRLFHAGEVPQLIQLFLLSLPRILDLIDAPSESVGGPFVACEILLLGLPRLLDLFTVRSA